MPSGSAAHRFGGVSARDLPRMAARGAGRRNLIQVQPDGQTVQVRPQDEPLPLQCLCHRRLPLWTFADQTASQGERNTSRLLLKYENRLTILISNKLPRWEEHVLVISKLRKEAGHSLNKQIAKMRGTRLGYFQIHETECQCRMKSQSCFQDWVNNI